MERICTVVLVLLLRRRIWTCSSIRFNLHMLITFKVQSHFRCTNTTFCNSALPAAREQRLSPLPHVTCCVIKCACEDWGGVEEVEAMCWQDIRNVLPPVKDSTIDRGHCLTWAVTSGRSTCRSCHNPSSSPHQCGTQTLLHECHFSVKNNTGFRQSCCDRQMLRIQRRGTESETSVYVCWQRTMGTVKETRLCIWH